LTLVGAPAPLQRLVAELGRLPGIGEKTALRLAFHILRSDQEYARGLAQAIVTATEKVRLCSVCCTLTDADPCGLCADPRRDGTVLCVVEGVQDLMAIERSREFRGRYHVLHGVLAPIEGVGPDQLRIKELLARLTPRDQPAVGEVIVATNPDVEGEATALYLMRLLRPLGTRVTRIAQGIPMGGDLEYADPATLARAIQARREL
jgi:recombination protein RecR